MGCWHARCWITQIATGCFQIAKNQKTCIDLVDLAALQIAILKAQSSKSAIVHALVKQSPGSPGQGRFRYLHWPGRLRLLCMSVCMLHNNLCWSVNCHDRAVQQNWALGHCINWPKICLCCLKMLERCRLASSGCPQRGFTLVPPVKHYITYMGTFDAMQL